MNMSAYDRPECRKRGCVNRAVPGDAYCWNHGGGGRGEG